MRWFARRRRAANVLPEGQAWDRCDTQRARSPWVLDPDSRYLPRIRVTPSNADELSDQEGCHVKGSQKPKKLGKKPAQKTLKERRTAKRAAAKHASRSLDV